MFYNVNIEFKQTGTLMTLRDKTITEMFDRIDKMITDINEYFRVNKLTDELRVITDEFNRELENEQRT